MTLIELAEEIEPQEPSYKLFVEAWFAMGLKDDGDSFNRFIELLDTGAFLEASVMLVPEGYFLRINGEHANAYIVKRVEGLWRWDEVARSDYTKTLAAAVVGACLRARKVLTSPATEAPHD